MNNFFTIYRYIVGFEYGFSGEGNEQWYYFLSLVINCMLTWWLKPQLGILFTLVAIFHLITVCAYGYMDLDESSKYITFAYFISHMILFVLCLTADVKWAFLTSAITIVAVLLAPDDMGNNIFMGPSFEERKIYFGDKNYLAIMFFHTILFTSFAIITFCLPIALWIRFAIIIICIILHPVIDLLEEECIIISDVTSYAADVVIDSIRKRKEK